ncbi:hypothetical protein [Mesorhizobium sp. M1273]
MSSYEAIKTETAKVDFGHYLPLKFPQRESLQALEMLATLAD